MRDLIGPVQCTGKCPKTVVNFPWWQKSFSWRPMSPFILEEDDGCSHRHCLFVCRDILLSFIPMRVVLTQDLVATQPGSLVWSSFDLVPACLSGGSTCELWRLNDKKWPKLFQRLVCPVTSPGLPITLGLIMPALYQPLFITPYRPSAFGFWTSCLIERM